MTADTYRDSYQQWLLSDETKQLHKNYSDYMQNIKTIDITNPQLLKKTFENYMEEVAKFYNLDHAKRKCYDD